MKQFDLKAALAGAEVVARGGWVGRMLEIPYAEHQYLFCSRHLHTPWVVNADGSFVGRDSEESDQDIVGMVAVLREEKAWWWIDQGGARQLSFLQPRSELTAIEVKVTWEE